MNEVAIIAEVPNDLTVAREPEVVLKEAQRAAACLKDVISKVDKPVIFNGKQYLQFEHWQTIGKFYGLLCSTMKPKQVEIGGVAGAEADSEVIDVRTGRVVGRASAWCLRDEPNWKNKPWYQLGSQAQTRAGAKALRNLLSWVVVLAGYGTTPAEEIEHVEIVGTLAETSPKTIQSIADLAIKDKWEHPAETASVRFISPKQAGRFWGIAKSSGATDEEIKEFLRTEIGSDQTKLIPAERYEQLCGHYQ